MLRFFLGKELNDRIASALEQTISDKVGKAIDDKNKISIEERKLAIEKEKLAFEKLKFDFTKNESEEKIKLEQEKLGLEKKHRELSYKYPSDIAASSRKLSANIRGIYALLAAAVVAGTTYVYLRPKEEEIKKRDSDLHDKSLKIEEISSLRTQVFKLSLNMLNEETRCMSEAIKNPRVLKSDLPDNITACKNQSVLYKACLKGIMDAESAIKTIESESAIKTPRGGV